MSFKLDSLLERKKEGLGGQEKKERDRGGKKKIKQS